ncbi:twin-arginine translocase subunit TatC [Streptomyces sp. NPDC045431]|uniref:twin-arginine translocase subunit TatC n=1 Tax=Streptomyces sp. NPDC045431 TaxID=3155613 RepID=UPI0033D191B8
MSLVEHLRELRKRLAIAVAAILVVTVTAAFFYEAITDFATRPILDAVGCRSAFAELARGEDKTCARLVLNGLIAPFSLALKVSLATGLVVAAPVWLYQLWAFIAPGLHRHERKYTLLFVGAGVPLFLAGGFLAYRTLPVMARVLLDFSPAQVDNQLPLDELLDLIVRMVVVFGFAFELPLLLVMLNVCGVVSGRKMLGWWRWMIMGVTLFSAIATPSTDPLSMLALAAPLWLLYALATVVALLLDRRRARSAAGGPSDDEASALDFTPEEIEEPEPEPVPAGRHA